MTLDTSKGDAGKLDELIERVEKLTGPDRELDADLCIALGYIGYADEPLNLRREDGNTGWLDYEVMEGGKLIDCTDQPPPLTASTDSALALRERALPGWTIARMSQGDNKLWTVELREGFLTSYGRVVIEPSHYRGTTLPLAIILATLRALKTLSGDSHG